MLALSALDRGTGQAEGLGSSLGRRELHEAVAGVSAGVSTQSRKG